MSARNHVKSTHIKYRRRGTRILGAKVTHNRGKGSESAQVRPCTSEAAPVVLGVAAVVCTVALDIALPRSTLGSAHCIQKPHPPARARMREQTCARTHRRHRLAVADAFESPTDRLPASAGRNSKPNRAPCWPQHRTVHVAVGKAGSWHCHSRCRCDRGEPSGADVAMTESSPGADVAGASPVPVQQ